MNKELSFLTGIAVGVAFMYVFDPRDGERRRALVREQLIRFAHKADDRINAVARDASNRAAGQIAKVRRRFRSDQPGDEVLVERVRAVLGRAVSHSSAIHVEAQDGTVRLIGPILMDEVSSLMRVVSAVPGVNSVDNQLHAHAEPGKIPSL